MIPNDPKIAFEVLPKLETIALNEMENPQIVQLPSMQMTNKITGAGTKVDSFLDATWRDRQTAQTTTTQIKQEYYGLNIKTPTKAFFVWNVRCDYRRMLKSIGYGWLQSLRLKKSGYDNQSI